MRETNNAYKIRVGKPRGKQELGRTIRRWEDDKEGEGRD
jgi:hypothetical protein